MTPTIALAFAMTLLAPLPSPAAGSTCHGTWNKGRLQDGVRVPVSGTNYEAYSGLGVVLGRTYVHSTVRSVMVDAYAAMATSRPQTTFLYGETGWREGGRFKPHRTHQNGLAVDFMVPVLDGDGKSVPLPTSIFNKFGYAIEFDRSGRYKGLRIDFEAVADHLHALHQAAHRRGIGMALVVFAPEFLPRLLETRHGDYLRRHVAFKKKPAWVRHDEHYHVYFSAPCKPLVPERRAGILPVTLMQRGNASLTGTR